MVSAKYCDRCGVLHRSQPLLFDLIQRVPESADLCEGCQRDLLVWWTGKPAGNEQQAPISEQTPVASEQPRPKREHAAKRGEQKPKRKYAHSEEWLKKHAKIHRQKKYAKESAKLNDDDDKPKTYKYVWRLR